MAFTIPYQDSPAHAGAHATVPRMYHGVSTLVASGAIWTGGTNPQVHIPDEIPQKHKLLQLHVKVLPQSWSLPVPRGNVPGAEHALPTQPEDAIAIS